MSLVVVGVSHRSAPMALLEQVALDAGAAEALAAALAGSEHLREVLLVATCNRLEVYAEAGSFHGSIAEIGNLLVAATGVPREQLTEHLYVHYEERVIAHLFEVASGLDSMAVGETQIIGQLRAALAAGQERGQVGPSLNSVVQQALHVAKRVHTETGLDHASVSLVEAGLAGAEAHVGPVAQARALVLGAGSMSSLAVATLRRAGCTDITIVNRTLGRAQHLAEAAGATALPMTDLAAALPQADIVVTCTGAVGDVLTVAAVAEALAARGGRAQAYVDLALPRDVAREAGELPGVTLLGLEEIGALLADADGGGQVGRARDLVTAEVAGYLVERRSLQVAPTVAALRARAAQVLEGEMARLASRVPDLGEREQAEVRLAMHRVVEKLLHTPTVRIKELAGSTDEADYAQALRELFNLDPYATTAVSAPPAKGGVA